MNIFLKCFPFFLIVFSPLQLFASPRIALSHAYWEIGDVEEGSILKTRLSITNTGDEPLNIEARGSCACISLDYPAKAVLPNEKIDILIAFDSSGFSGEKTDYVYIDSNDPDNGHIAWIIEANVISTPAQQPLPASRPEAGPVASASEKLTIELYGTPGCSLCNTLKQEIIPQLARKHQLELEIHEFLLNIPANYERLIFLEKKFNHTRSKLPAVIVGNKVFGGKDEIEGGFEEYILSLQKAPIPSPGIPGMIDTNSIKKDIRQFASSFTALPIIAAALIDGFNPCAFAGIVFLVTYLSMMQKKPFWEVFWTGMMFIGGILVMYFLIGLGISKIFMYASKIKYVSKAIYALMGLGTLALAYYSFMDYHSLQAAEKGMQSKVVLQLPPWLKATMHDFIQRYSNVRYLIPFGFVLGVVVSFMEFFCTGQIYLPTIMYMMGIPELKTKAILYLILYACMFILPLVFIFISILISSRSGRLQAMGRSQVKKVKLFTGFLFLVLSFFMFFYVI